MKFKAEKGILGAALGALVRIINDKNAVAAAGDFLFEGKDGKLHVTATDLDIFVTCDVETTEVSEGRMLLPAKTLVELVKTLPEGVVSFDSEGAGYNQAAIAWDGGKASLPLFDDVFPEPKGVDSEEVIPVDGKALGNAVALALASTANDPIRPQFCGVFLNFKPEGLDVAATDTKELIVVSIEGSFKPVSVLLAKKFAQTIKAFASEEEATMEMRTDGRNAEVKVPGAVITGTLLTGKYPDYSRVVPSGEDTQTLVLGKEDFCNTLNRVAKGSGAPVVRLDLALGSVLVEAQNLAFGSAAKETLMAPYAGEPLKVAFTEDKLRGILSRMPGEEVSLMIKNERQAVLVVPVNQPSGYSIKAVLMPVASR